MTHKQSIAAGIAIKTPGYGIVSGCDITNFTTMVSVVVVARISRFSIVSSGGYFSFRV